MMASARSILSLSDRFAVDETTVCQRLPVWSFAFAWLELDGSLEVEKLGPAAQAGCFERGRSSAAIDYIPPQFPNSKRSNNGPSASAGKQVKATVVISTL